MREIDKTHLSIDGAENRGLIHRDYIAHCFRWSHVVKHLLTKGRYKTARILDVGCGKETPLIKTLYVNKMTPQMYHGVDINKIEWTTILGKIRDKGCELAIYDKRNFVDYGSFYNYTHVTCFEMLEHIAPRFVKLTLHKISAFLEDGGFAFISTPCWDPHVGAAGNHINEMRRDVTEYLIQEAGLQIVQTFGTFASQKDYADQLTASYGDNGKRMMEDLKEYYDSNIISIIFAPLFPEFSRNNLWVCKKNTNRPLQGDRPTVATPWSSSEQWEQLI